MRKLIASVFVTLDGYMVGPNEDMSWVMDNFNDQMAKYAGDLMESMDTIVLGRVTYEIMTKFWPANTEETAPGANNQLLLHPIVLASGKPLFANMTQPLNLKLLRTETYKNGVVVLYYAPELSQRSNGNV